MSRLLLLLLAAGAGACVSAYADVPPVPPVPPSPVTPDPAGPSYGLVELDALDAAIETVARSGKVVADGVLAGTIDPRVDGPAIVIAFARLSLSVSRMDLLVAQAAPADLAAAAVADGEVPEAAEGEGRAPGGAAPSRPSTPGQIVSVGGVKKPETAAGAASAATEPAPADTSSADAGGLELTGVASVDKFLSDSVRLSSAMVTSRTTLESARSKTAEVLGLSKKFKPDEAKSALRKNLGSFKVSKGPPVKLVPGDDAAKPEMAGSLQGVVADIMVLKDSVPKMVTTAVDLGKQGAALPTTAKQELLALGPMTSAKAIGKITKQVKVVTKIPKDAKELSAEVAEWVKVFSGG